MWRLDVVLRTGGVDQGQAFMALFCHGPPCASVLSLSVHGAKAHHFSWETTPCRASSNHTSPRQRCQ